MKYKVCILYRIFNVSNCIHRQEFTHSQLLCLNEWHVICEYESESELLEIHSSINWDIVRSLPHLQY